MEVNIPFETWKFSCQLLCKLNDILKLRNLFLKNTFLIVTSLIFVRVSKLSVELVMLFKSPRFKTDNVDNFTLMLM